MNCILNTLKREVIKQNRILADETAAQMDALQQAELAKIDEIYRNVQKILSNSDFTKFLYIYLI